MAHFTTISIPNAGDESCWAGTTNVPCPCGVGGIIVWAEAGYAPGYRACRRCLRLFKVRGTGSTKQLIVQTVDDTGIIRDAKPREKAYRVPANLYPGFKVV